MLPEGEAEAFKSFYAVWNPCRSTAEFCLLALVVSPPFVFWNIAIWRDGGPGLSSVFFFLGWDTNNVVVGRLPFAR